MPWDDETAAKVVKLATTGSLQMKEIADQLGDGFTKSAVSGKLHRIRKKAEADGDSPETVNETLKKKRSTAQETIKLEKNTKVHDCHWRNPLNGCSCGNKSLPGRAYCKDHI